VIILEGDPGELAVRLILTQRERYNRDKLQTMQATLDKAYAAGSTGVVKVDTRGLLPPDVARRVAAIVHLEDYKEFDLHARLESIKDRGFDGA
jgi:hypothetical protein